MNVEVKIVDGAWRAVWNGKVTKTFKDEAEAASYAKEMGISFPKRRVA